MMTNAEKYQEIFGFPPDRGNCPTEDCKFCPCVSKNSMGDISCLASYTSSWWNSEYKGGAE